VKQHQIQQFSVVNGHLKQTKDIESILAGAKSRANFMPETIIIMNRKLAMSVVNNCTFKPYK
jgi:hypothetical protein